MGTSSPDLVEEMFYVTTRTMSSRHVHVLTFWVHKQSVQSAFPMKSTHTVYATLYTCIAKTVTSNPALRARGFPICARAIRETHRRVCFFALLLLRVLVLHIHAASERSGLDFTPLIPHANKHGLIRLSTPGAVCFCLPAEQLTCAHFYAVLIMSKRSG